MIIYSMKKLLLLLVIPLLSFGQNKDWLLIDTDEEYELLYQLGYDDIGIDDPYFSNQSLKEKLGDQNYIYESKNGNLAILINNGWWCGSGGCTIYLYTKELKKIADYTFWFFDFENTTKDNLAISYDLKHGLSVLRGSINFKTNDFFEPIEIISYEARDSLDSKHWADLVSNKDVGYYFDGYIDEYHRIDIQKKSQGEILLENPYNIWNPDKLIDLLEDFEKRK
tara:strand:+ start:478 stop:1149 length:672 start_codon:yes stop_codon:yes gene_type:complete